MKWLCLTLIAVVCMPTLADCVRIDNATVETPGSAEQRSIALEDGRIIDVATAGDDCRIVDATGLVLTAGLIDAASGAGIVEVPSVDGTNDARLDSYVLGAGFDPSYAFNPMSEVIRVARVDGVLAGAVMPSPGPDPFAGLVRVFAYSNTFEPLTNEPPGLLVRFGSAGAAITGGSRAATIQHLMNGMREARHYDRNRRQYERGSHPPLSFSRIDLEALVQVANRDMPIFAAVDRAADIEMLLTVTADLEIDLTILSGADAWKVAGQLAEREVAVVMNPLTNHAQFEYLGARLDNAALLEDAGVEIAISPFSASDSRKIRQLAGIAVANGLSREAAIAAITSAPAKILGIDSLTGSLTVGQRADLVLWNGDPLELSTYPVEVFVGGESMDLTSRQIRLAERYRDLDTATPLHLR